MLKWISYGSFLVLQTAAINKIFEYKTSLYHQKYKNLRFSTQMEIYT